MKSLLFDIGGSNLRYVFSPGRFQPTIIPVPKKYERAIAIIVAEAKKHHARAIIGGLPGPMDRGKTKLVQSTHLPDWVGRPFVQDLQKASGARVRLENDNALVGLGEAWYGPGKGSAIVAYIGVGTGIGGVRIVDGEIDISAHGFEPGHHILDMNIAKHRHPSPHPGDWESLVSGTGVFYQTGKKSESITSRTFWRGMEKRMALGLINTAVFWSPEIIVLGGSLMKRLTVAGIEAEFKKHMKIFPRQIPIRRAKLGDFGGLYGALALARRR